MSTRFDLLPLDVINFVIKPYISDDYLACIALNGVLPPIDREGRRLRKDAVRELGLSLETIKLQRLLDASSVAVGAEAKIDNICELFEFLIHNQLLLEHNFNFKETAVAKAIEFADTNCEQYTLVDEAVKAILLNKSLEFLEFLEKTPFLYQLRQSAASEKWTAVDGIGSCVIADNSHLIAIAQAKERAKAAEAEKVRRSKPHWRAVNRYRGGSIRRGSRYDDDDDDDIYEYGYFDKDNVWVFLKGNSNDEEYDS